MEFIRNNQFMTAVKRSPYQFQDGSFSGWAILYLPSRDQYGHQDGDREEFRTEAERDAAFAELPVFLEIDADKERRLMEENGEVPDEEEPDYSDLF